MVFCCVAIVGFAIVYFVGLWIRQVFSFPRPDLTSSDLPAPPRALSGNGALPVYGHTRLFAKLAGDVALLFPPDWREVPFLPEKWSRRLGSCFAIFIWGQWRVVVKGPERTKKIIESGQLKESWPWAPPVTLLGKSSFSFLPENERQQLRILISRPLSHKSAIQYAPLFAELAEKCLEEITADTARPRGKRSTGRTRRNVDIEYGTDMEDDTFSLGPGGEASFKLKWEALRSYTLDIVDGPILGMYRWIAQPDSRGKLQKKDPKPEKTAETSSLPGNPSRDLMLLWMDRMKKGIDVIKFTFGPEWMRIWMTTEYGRALNARMHLEKELKGHIAKVAESVPVPHPRGHTQHDPTTQPIPLLTMRANAQRNKEDIFGKITRSHENLPTCNRPRSRSMPAVDSEFCSPSESSKENMQNQSERGERTSSVGIAPSLKMHNGTSSSDRQGLPCIAHRNEKDIVLGESDLSFHRAPQNPKPCTSVLEDILQQEDLDGKGITQAVTSEITILLWLMMEVGNAWTSMALHLLSTDKDACNLVQEELHRLEIEHGHSQLFKGEVLEKMTYLDALLCEAIRLVPSNLGGLKVTTETVEFEDLGIQVPKGSDVIFCQPTDEQFDLHAAVGKRPEAMGRKYPTVELHGFLPLQGLEVPFMVMQSKVFLICLLQKFSPLMCKRKTIIRRLGESVRKRISNHNGGKDLQVLSHSSDEELKDNLETCDSVRLMEMTQGKAMSLFTKLPFPEPKRVTKLRPRILE